MPTLRGLRRRGFTPKSIQILCNLVGISKQDSIIDISLLEQAIREDLNQRVFRKNVVLKPLEVHIDDLKPQLVTAPNHPKNNYFGSRNLSVSNRIYIEQDDFMEKLEVGCKKLSLMGRARLLNMYVIECYQVIKNDHDIPILLKCRYLPETLGGKKSADKKSPAAIIHWVDANNSITAEIREYGRLFNCENPSKLIQLEEGLNPNSLNIIRDAKLEKSLENSTPETHFQFNRQGYFCTDRHDHNPENQVYNKIVGLRNTCKKF